MLDVFFLSISTSSASENLCPFKHSYIMEKLASFQFFLIHLQVGPNSMEVYRCSVYISAYPNLDGFIYLKEVSLMQVGIILILQFNHVGNVVVTCFSLTFPLPSFAFKNPIYPPMSSHPRLLDYLRHKCISCFITSRTFSKSTTSPSRSR